MIKYNKKIDFRLSEEMYTAIEAMAMEHDVKIGTMVRMMLKKQIDVEDRKPITKEYMEIIDLISNRNKNG